MIIYLAIRKYLISLDRLKIRVNDVKVAINILNHKLDRENNHRAAFQQKIGRYKSLRNTVEEINKNLSLDFITDRLSEIAFGLIAKNQGVCILYLIDNNQSPYIFKSKKADRGMIIKSKEGDLFDRWVLKHGTPLFLENTKSDFRFDLEKLKEQGERKFSSVISAPFIAGNKLLGILRLEHPNPNYYTQDDLRFLVNICDLGTVALENGQLFAKIQELAIHDELTSLYTRGYFMERLQEEFRRSLRQARPLSLLLIDIDYFKNYNDQFGHTAGDIVLKRLSKNLLTILDEFSPIISRFGGEEFCVILPDVDKNKALLIADDLRIGIEKIKIILRKQETSVAVSIGVASLPQDASDENELIFKADKAMYAAKQKGRNKVCSA